jgi:streptogramin lyase
VDQAGNIWFPNACANNACIGSVTGFIGGNPSSLVNITGGGIEEPFSTAVDGTGNVWVSNNGTQANSFNSMLTKLPAADPTHPVGFAGGGTRGSKGIAVDSLGNVWVSNLLGPTVSAFDNSGVPFAGTPYSDPSVKGPWGIAVDGADLVWVADFTGRSLIQLCGAVTANCPPGVTTGQPISPPTTGFDGGGALEQLTQVAIDPAGNVWLANNAIAVSPVYIAGDGMAEFIGLAAPVVTPMLGPPRKP